GGSYNNGTSPQNIINSSGGDGAVYIGVSQPCSGSPAVNALSVPAPFCAGIGATMNFTNSGAYFCQSGISIQWYSSSLQAGPYTAVSGATTTSYFAGSMPPGSTAWFEAVVTCANAPSSSTTLAPIQVTVNAASQCYCTPSGANYYLNSIT